MDDLNKRKRQVTVSYTKWTKEEKKRLIDLRIIYDGMFTGKNANQRDGWKQISRALGKSSALCRQQWQALIRKYKELTQKSSGIGTGDERPQGDVGLPTNWPYFDALHKYASKKDNFHPPHLSCSVEGISDSPSNFPHPSDEDTVAESESPGPSTDDSRSTPISSSSSRSSRSFSKVETDLLKETRKIGKKISAALTIFGQIAQQEFPNIDVSALLISESDNSS